MINSPKRGMIITSTVLYKIVNNSSAIKPMGKVYCTLATGTNYLLCDCQFQVEL